MTGLRLATAMTILALAAPAGAQAGTPVLASGSATRQMTVTFNADRPAGPVLLYVAGFHAASITSPAVSGLNASWRLVEASDGPRTLYLFQGSGLMSGGRVTIRWSEVVEATAYALVHGAQRQTNVRHSLDFTTSLTVPLDPFLLGDTQAGFIFGYQQTPIPEAGYTLLTTITLGGTVEATMAVVWRPGADTSPTMSWVRPAHSKGIAIEALPLSTTPL